MITAILLLCLQPEDQLRQWIADLGHADAAVRDEAYESLRALGARAVPHLEPFRDDADPERAGRVRALLAALAPPEADAMDRALAELARRGYPTTPSAWISRVPDEENAAPFLDAAVLRLAEIAWVNDLRQWNREKPPADWAREIDRLADVRREVAAAVARPHCRWPVDWTRGYAAELPHLTSVMRLQQALVAAAGVYRREGRSDDADACLTTAARITDVLREEPTVITFLVRVVNARRVLEEVRASLADGAEPAALEACLPAEPTREEFARSLASEVVIAQGDLDLGAEEMRRAYAGLVGAYLSALDAMGLPYEECRARLDEIRGSDALAATMLPAFAAAYGRLVEVQAQGRMARLACRAHAFRRQMGRFPASLDELGSAPLDPYTAAPFRYRREEGGWVIDSPHRDALPPDSPRAGSLRWRLKE